MIRAVSFKQSFLIFTRIDIFSKLPPTDSIFVFRIAVDLAENGELRFGETMLAKRTQTEQTEAAS